MKINIVNISLFRNLFKILNLFGNVYIYIIELTLKIKARENSFFIYKIFETYQS